jgi:hypothetical protein
MHRYAIVKNGIVENIILWDGNPETWAPPEWVLMVPVNAGAVIGGTWGGEGFGPAISMEGDPS